LRRKGGWKVLVSDFRKSYNEFVQNLIVARAVIVLSPKPLAVAGGYLFPEGSFSLRFVSQPKEVRHVQVKY